MSAIGVTSGDIAMPAAIRTEAERAEAERVALEREREGVVLRLARAKAADAKAQFTRFQSAAQAVRYFEQRLATIDAELKRLGDG
jgi:uncharacterized protein (DUF3084 family)